MAEGAVGVQVSDPVTPRMSWGTPHGRAVAPKMIKLRRSSIVACYRNLSSIVACYRNLSSSWASLSGALGSVPAGAWVSFPALRGRKRNLGIGTKKEPKAPTTMPMMTEGGQLHEGDYGFR